MTCRPTSSSCRSPAGPTSDSAPAPPLGKHDIPVRTALGPPAPMLWDRLLRSHGEATSPEPNPPASEAIMNISISLPRSGAHIPRAGQPWASGHRTLPPTALCFAHGRLGPPGVARCAR
ncbi:hypothetical protein CALVIDRAFT_537225 [Calocera viscosa TUFC12733]|uniref:Uncharacterized protein n=1 Tax=Calocera viscosa (strain TUFC12733) TaxID=1330018 RepID=A0A167M8P1_CALVF|nr:hypothetical protein CALVIDRAFT_537225 [Calocera viscosa TUFC12733]